MIDFAEREKSEEKLAVQTYKGVSVRKKRNCPECLRWDPPTQEKAKQSKIFTRFGSLFLSLSLSSHLSLYNNNKIVYHLSHALAVFLSNPQPLQRCHVSFIKLEARLFDESGERWSLRVVDFLFPSH